MPFGDVSETKKRAERRSFCWNTTRMRRQCTNISANWRKRLTGSNGWMNLNDDFDLLIQQAREGDARAMETLVKRYEPEVRIVARLRLGAVLRPYLDSVDIVQSVHKSLIIGLQNDRFDIASPQKLVALAMTIVRRKVARQWRKMRRQQRLQTTDSAENLPELLASLSSPLDDPAMAAEQKSEIERIFSKLSSVEQQVIELKLEGLSTAEAARELGLDADVLRVQLSRLRQRLRDAGILFDLL